MCLTTSVLPYLALCLAMHGMFAGGLWWPAVVVAVPASGFLVRSYIVFHDCAHGSLLPAKRGNA